MNNICSVITKQTGFDYSKTIKPSLVLIKNQETYPFIQNKDFNEYNINLNTDYFVPKYVAESFPKILIDKPSILISISGKIGNIGFYDLKEKAFIGGAVCICKIKDNENGKFVLYELLSQNKQKYFKDLIKASSHFNITVEDIRKIKINLPINNYEKFKIATFLTLIDKRIETQIKIIKEYKSLIKGIRDKLIYKNKSLNKVIKIKDIADCLGGHAFDSSTYVKRGKYKVITIGNVTGDEYINISNTNFIDTLPNDMI